jgi:hypothetical protein
LGEAEFHRAGTLGAQDRVFRRAGGDVLEGTAELAGVSSSAICGAIIAAFSAHCLAIAAPHEAAGPGA